MAVVKDGEVVFKKAYGLADSEHGIPFTSSTVFEFASVAKQFAGFAVATLVQEGDLRLDDEIHTYLPELPDFGEEITVRHMLHHTSGIRDWVALVKLSGRYEGDAITDEFLMKLAAYQKDLNFKPGEEFRYSNLGYFLLARIVEQASGQSFRQWTDERIFQPLGMNDTHFCDEYREIVPNRAGSYIRTESGRYVKSTDQKEGYGSSSLFSTLDDMIKWMANYETHQLGGPEVWSTMLEPGTLNNNEETRYGFGISLNNHQGLESVGHGGSWAGFLCQVSYYPAHNTSTILMINRDPAGFLLSGKLERILFGDGELPDTTEIRPDKRTVMEIDPGILSDYVGIYRSGGMLAWVECNQDQLMVVFPGGQRVWIHPEAEDLFFGSDFDIRFSFLRGEDGTVEQMVYSLSGDEGDPLLKQSGGASGFSDVEAFRGDYDCPELRTTYSVVVKNDYLILEHLHNEDVHLHQLDRNTYLGNKWWCTKIEVTRDAEDRITGFKLSADNNGVQDLVFVRKAGNGQL